MKAKTPSIFEMLADIPKKEVDESAFTIKELCSQANLPRRAMYERAVEMVKAGKWEQAWKRGGSRLVPAYRKKK